MAAKKKAKKKKAKKKAARKAAARRPAAKRAKKPAKKAARKPARKAAKKPAARKPAASAVSKTPTMGAAPAMSGLKVGDRAPDFNLATDGGGMLSLSSLRGKNVVLYFYPKDDTPGCTREACGFNDSLPDFSGANAEIVGVS